MEKFQVWNHSRSTEETPGRVTTTHTKQARDVEGRIFGVNAVSAETPEGQAFIDKIVELKVIDPTVDKSDDYFQYVMADGRVGETHWSGDQTLVEEIPDDVEFWDYDDIVRE